MVLGINREGWLGAENKAREETGPSPWAALELERLFAVVSSWVRG